MGSVFVFTSFCVPFLARLQHIKMANFTNTTARLDSEDKEKIMNKTINN